jgi:RNA polymerase sigma-70 factor, ECF subfamily
MSGDENVRDARALFDAAREAWPGIEVAFSVFAARVAEGGGRASAYANDLYLACACAQGNDAALREFEQHYLAGIRGAVARIDNAPDFLTEVQQLLRERLFVGDSAKINEYRGNGPLAGWVRTAAVRTALNLRRTPRRELSPDDLRPPDEPLDPEAALLRDQYREEISRAIRNALQTLTPEDRVLLRWTYLDRLTLAKIGVLQGVSAPTVHRRLTATMAALIAAVRSELATRLELSRASLDSLIRGVDSQMDISLSQLFRAE